LKKQDDTARHLGHSTCRMLEHCSHMRIDAKRQAIDALDAQRSRSVYGRRSLVRERT